jgi:hypothetical protein
MKTEKHIMVFNILFIIFPYILVSLFLNKIKEANSGIVLFAVTLAVLFCIFFTLFYASSKVVMYVSVNENHMYLLSFLFHKREFEWSNIAEIALNLEGRNVQNLYLRLNNGTQINYWLNFNPFATEGEVTSLIVDSARSNNIRVIDSLSK